MKIELVTSRVVHTFRMEYVEDPDIYVAAPIYSWQQTELGQWVMQHGTNHQYFLKVDHCGCCYQVEVTADLQDLDWDKYFQLTQLQLSTDKSGH